jgi:hypothetical protein
MPSDALEFGLVTGALVYYRTGGTDVEQELENFRKATGHFTGEWINVENDFWVSRSAIVTAKALRGLDDSFAFGAPS